MSKISVKKYINGDGGPLVILGVSEGKEEMAGAVFNLVKESAPEKPFVLASIAVNDWNQDFSPWTMEGLREGESFAGGGKETLENINRIINTQLASYSNNKVFIAGYSLAGLFSLWSLYSCDLFDGCACCSGSLWFEDWTRFAENNKIKKQGIIYLSLGGKEEKTKDSVMATIGNATRQQEKILERDPSVKKKTLVMNPGGHFASPDKRLAQGIKWLLENYDK